MLRLPTTQTLRLGLLALVSLLAFACEGTTVVPGADPIIEPGPPALEPRMTQASASTQYLETSEPAAQVMLEMGFEDLDLTQVGQVPLVGTMRVEFLDGSVQSLELPLPTNTLANGSDPSAFAATLSNSQILALEVSPGQSLADLLDSVSSDAYAIVFELTGRDSELNLTNEVSTDVPRPLLTSLSVAGGAPGTSVVSVLNGVNLSGANTVLVAGADIETEILGADPRNDENHLVVRFDVAAEAQAGSHSVRVVTAGGISAGASQVAFEVIIPDGPIFAAQQLPAATQGLVYQASLSVAGGNAPLAYEVTSGMLPAGLILDPANGEIIGTPTESGSFALAFEVTDDNALSDQIPLTLSVAPPPSDGRDDLSDQCDTWADAIAASNAATQAVRATGSTDGVPATLENIMPALTASRALNDTITSVAALDVANASYIVFDLGDVGCEHGVASAARTADILIRDPDRYIDSIVVWAGNDPAQLGRRVHSMPRNAGTFGTDPIGIDLGDDGMRLRYLTIASNDANIPNLDSIEVLPEDTTPPQTTILLAEKLTLALMQADNGPVLHATFMGDDTEGGENPAGSIDRFRYRFDSDGMSGPWQEVGATGGMGEIYEELTLDGTYELLVAAVDDQGNEDSTPDSVGFVIDTTPPEVTNISPDPMAMNFYRAATDGFANIELRADITDAQSGVDFTIADPIGAPDPEPFVLTSIGAPTYRGFFSAASFFNSAPTSGTYVLNVRARDAFGNLNDAGSTEVTVAINQPPQADAGADGMVLEGEPYTALSSASTSDPESDPISFSWEQTAGPQVLLKDAATAAPSFSAPAIPTNTPVTLTFKVTARDDWNGVATDSVSITVNNDNQPPVASPSGPGYARSGTNVQLSGAGSFDADQDGLLPVWNQLPGGPVVSLQNSTTLTPSFTAPNVGDADCPNPECTLTFQLTVADGHGGVDADTVTVIVRDLNLAPTADAGPAMRTIFDGNSISFDSSASFDLDGTIVTHQWDLVAGSSALIPDWASIPKTFPTLSIPAIEAGGASSFTFELTVFDNLGASDTDTVVVNVEGACAQSFSLIDRAQGFAAPTLMAADENRDHLYVLSAENGGGLRRIDAGAADQVSVVSTSLTTGATDLKLNATFSRLYWVTQSSGGRLVSYNVTGGTTTSLLLGAGYTKLAVNESGGEVYALNTTSGALAVVHSGFALRGTVALTLSDPANADLAYNPVDDTVWVRDGSTIYRVDPAAPALMDTFSPAIGGASDSLAIDPASGEAVLSHENGFAVVDTNLAIEDFTLSGSGPFRVYPAEVAGHYYATDRAPGTPNDLIQRLYRIERATGAVETVSLTMTPDTQVRTAIAHESNADEIVVLHGPLAGGSAAFSVGSTETLTNVERIDLAGGPALTLATVAGNVYSLQRGGMVSNIDAAGAGAQNIPLSLNAAGLVIDPVTGDTYVATGALQQMRIVMPGSPIAVAGTDLRDRVDALTPAFDRMELYALGLPRETQSGATQIVTGTDGVSATPTSGPTTIGTAGGRSEVVYDAGAGAGGVLYETNAAAPSIIVTDLDGGPLNREIPLPVVPRSLHLESAQGRLWVGAFADDAIVRIDVDEPGDPLQVVPTLEGPSEIVQSPTTGMIYVRCEQADRVLAIDPESATVAAIIDAGLLGRTNFGTSNERRRTLLADPSTSNIYVLREGGMNGPGVSVIESSLSHSVRELPQFSGFAPRSMALDDGRRLLFVTDNSPLLHAIRLDEDFALNTLEIPLTPNDTRRELVGTDSAGGRVYVTGTHVMTLMDLNPGCGIEPVQYGALELPLMDGGTRYARLLPNRLFSPWPGENRMQRRFRRTLAGVLPNARCMPADSGTAIPVPTLPRPKPLNHEYGGAK